MTFIKLPLQYTLEIQRGKMSDDCDKGEMRKTRRKWQVGQKIYGKIEESQDLLCEVAVTQLVNISYFIQCVPK